MKRVINFDAGRHCRGKIGFVLLSTEQTAEDDLFSIIPRDVGVHFSRAAIPDQISVETLREMTGGISQAASLLVPDGHLNVVCYACTSGSVVIGEERVVKELLRGAPNASATTLISCVVRALDALNARRIVVATPYVQSINDIQREFLIGNGFDVLSIEGLDIQNDSDIVRVTPLSILEFAQSLDCKEADAIFISCSALRSLEIVDELEQRTGKPVVVSNQAMAWHTMRLAGIQDKVEHCGHLLRTH